MNPKTKIVTIITLLTIGTFAWWSLHDRSAAEDNLLTARVTRGALTETVNANGILEPSRTVQVGAQVTGQLKAVHVSLGEEVKAGDLIAEIDSLQQQNELRQAKASLSEARATARSRQYQLEKAKRGLSRQRELHKGQAGTGADLQDAEAAVDIATAEVDGSVSQIERATVEVEKAETNVGYTRILAPIDGRVIALVAKPGQTLNAAQTTPVIAVIAQTDTMTARVQVSEADIGRIQIGQKVRFTIYGDRRTVRETVLREVEPAPASILTTDAVAQSQRSAGTTAQAVYYDVLFDAPNTDEVLKPMMTAEVTIIVNGATDVILTPWQSLTGPDQKGRYRARVKTKDGGLENRDVTIGLTDRLTAEVKSGLAEGDEVFISTGVGTSEANP
jgi:macrolide-specific efflux system membrane fusion protein